MKILNNQPYIIAEIGINHEGDFNLAKKTIKSAALAGANAIKLQIFNPKTLAQKESAKTPEQKSRISKKETLLQMLKRMTLNLSQYKKLKLYTKKKSLDFICSIFDEESLNLSKKIGLDAYKIASPDLTDLKLLSQIKKVNKPIILSTGMSSYNEIKSAIKELKGKNIYLLHCVSLYPCPTNFVNLKRIKSLSKKFNLPTGYSDHSIGINACFGAIMMGSKVIEKHFTLNKKWKGADHELSADQKDMAMICNFANSYQKLRGKGVIEPSNKEIKMRKFFRKSLFAKKSMKVGETISLEKVEARRPGLYIKSDNISKIIGKKIKKSIFKDEPIKRGNIK
jgi:N,N'-diacetyllegionaminate synthase